MTEYECHIEDQGRTSKEHLGEHVFTFRFKVEPSPGDTIYATGVSDEHAYLWRVVRRHYHKQGGCNLILRRYMQGTIPA